MAFCFFGYPAARFVLALWGAVFGFVLGVTGYAVAVSWVGGTIGNIAPWVAGGIAALVLGGLAFAFYSFGVLLAMGSLGWALGQAVATAVPLPSWIGVTIPVIAAAGLVIVTWAFDLPRILLIVGTAFIGAAGIIDGVQLLLGHQTRWYESLGPSLQAGADLIWLAAAVGLGIVGSIFQSRLNGQPTLRAAYN
ncbi:MAG: DUF4203 domain-containing protein [Propionicimonas sp.]